MGEDVAPDASEDPINLSGVAAALAVLAGIAAADAACCHSLGARSRGQDHRQAVALLGTVVPDGSTMASDLDRLLDLKDNAHYGVLGVSKQEARSAMAQALRIVTAAKATLAAP